MPAMATVLTEFSTNGDSKTNTLAAHTVSRPQLLIEKRKVPVGNQVVAESTVSIVIATVDASGVIMPTKYNYTITARTPIGGLAADATLALTVLRDVVASDDFANTLATQEWL